MRLSTEPEDPDYDPEVFGVVAVKLDGVTQTWVISADEDKGEIVIIARDAAGRALHRDDEYLTERKTGKVEIIIDDAARRRITASRLSRAA